MPIDPQVKTYYEQKKAATSGASAADSADIRDIIWAARINADKMYNDKAQFPPVYMVQDAYVPCFWGQLPIRIYTPGDARLYPVLIYFHGGGFMLHNIASHDSICRKLSVECNAIVVNVGYRLIPEVKLGDCLTDAYLALEWVYNNASSFGGDASRIAVGGDSAGAMISASLSLLARDRRGPKIGLQILAYGTGCGLTEEESASFRELIDNNYVLSRSFMGLVDAAQGDSLGVTDMYMNPGRCPDLSCMPKTFSLNAEYDPLRDDGEEYARRLKAAGNNVISWRVPGMMHGFMLLWDRFDTARFALEEIGRVFRETFYR